MGKFGKYIYLPILALFLSYSLSYPLSVRAEEGHEIITEDHAKEMVETYDK
ncbi:hypothetical protein [Bacillus changyiensis]|uniref:hypothetical protein n=1 Tax=Bacillus changyiensis TaxID=3004103 RepID=UPI0022E56D90|nr:hypothetical protein [Bacillus changyiensis]MDA1477159.1 hypothetical protein [Bacillus changyiensis]